MSGFREVRQNPGPFVNPYSQARRGGEGEDGPGDPGADGGPGAADPAAYGNVPVDPKVAGVMSDLLDHLERGVVAPPPQRKGRVETAVRDALESIVRRLEQEEKRSLNAKWIGSAPGAQAAAPRYEYESSESEDEEEAMRGEEEAAAWMRSDEAEAAAERSAGERQRYQQQKKRRDGILSTWNALSGRQQKALCAMWELETKMRELHNFVLESLGAEQAEVIVPFKHWHLLFRKLHSLESLRRSRVRRSDMHAIDMTLHVIETLENSLNTARAMARLPGVIKGGIESVMSTLCYIKKDVEVINSLDRVMDVLEAVDDLVLEVEAREEQDLQDQREVEMTVMAMVESVCVMEDMITDIDKGLVDEEYSGEPLVFSLELISDRNPFKRELAKKYKRAAQQKKKGAAGGKGVRFASENQVQDIAELDKRRGFLVGDEGVDMPVSEESKGDGADEKKSKKKKKKFIIEEGKEPRWTAEELARRLTADKLPAYALFPDHFRRAAEIESSLSTTNRSEMNSLASDEERGGAKEDQDSDEERQDKQSIREILRDLHIPEKYAAVFEEQEVRLDDVWELENADVEKMIPEKDYARIFNDWRASRSAEKKRIREAKENARAQGSADVPDTLHDLFAQLKIPSRYADYFEANGKKMSHLLSMGNSELKKLLPPRGPRVRLQAFIRNNKAAFKAKKKEIEEREAKAEYLERMHSVDEYGQWIRDMQAKLQQREEVKAKLREDGLLQVGAKDAGKVAEIVDRDIVIRFPARDHEVDIPAEATKLLLERASGELERWDTALRLAERGYGSVEELHKVTHAFDPAKRTENLYQQELEELTRGVDRPEDEARKEAVQSRLRKYNLSRVPDEDRGCTTNSGCVVM
jgi:hypothetical protein